MLFMFMLASNLTSSTKSLVSISLTILASAANCELVSRRRCFSRERFRSMRDWRFGSAEAGAAVVAPGANASEVLLWPPLWPMPLPLPLLALHSFPGDLRDVARGGSGGHLSALSAAALANGRRSRHWHHERHQRDLEVINLSRRLGRQGSGVSGCRCRCRGLVIKCLVVVVANLVERGAIAIAVLIVDGDVEHIQHAHPVVVFVELSRRPTRWRWRWRWRWRCWHHRRRRRCRFSSPPNDG